MRRFSRAAMGTSIPSLVSPVSCRRLSIKALVKQYGLPLAAYYFCFNEACVLVITYLLHTEKLGCSDIISLLEYLGVDKYVDVRSHSSASTTLMGIEVSGKLLMNFGVATAFMSLWTPLQIPFCIATLPSVMRLFRRAPAKVVTASGH